MPPPRPCAIIKRVYWVYKVLRYDESKAVESVKKIYATPNLACGAARFPHPTESATFYRKGRGKCTSPLHTLLKKQAAFTLAEVLITLGIIGVVAAITMPALINKYQAQVLRTQFLQANSILQDGISRMRFDEVDLNEVINKRNSAIIAQYFENGHCTKLAADAAASDLVQPYCLKNGMILWFGKLRQMGPDGGSSWSDDDRYSLLAMDINGWKKKPDRYGQDVFFWYLDPDTNMVKPVGDYGDFPTSFYYTTCPGDRENSSEAGIGCTAKALSDPEYFKKTGLSK